MVPTLNLPIRVFVTGDLPFYTTVVGKDGMGKAHCHWCKLPSSKCQTYGHAAGTKWALEELKRVADSLDATAKKTENEVKSYTPNWTA